MSMNNTWAISEEGATLALEDSVTLEIELAGERCGLVAGKLSEFVPRSRRCSSERISEACW
jgi:hypothetical protein